jgi:hypothetical protein
MSNTDDVLAIIATLTRYATGVDKRDWPLLRTCFTDDFVGDYPGFGAWTSGDEITVFMEQVHATLGPSLHRMTNFTITVDGDSATAHSYVDALLLPFTEGDPVRQAMGTYDDKLVRTNQGWRLQHRFFRGIHMA